MENNNNTDDFEQFLKETTDNFRMYPSKRVWHGLYNDLHPGRKWPSLAILLLLITSIMYIGLTNPKETSLVAKRSIPVPPDLNLISVKNTTSKNTAPERNSLAKMRRNISSNAQTSNNISNSDLQVASSTKKISLKIVNSIAVNETKRRLNFTKGTSVSNIKDASVSNIKDAFKTSRLIKNELEHTTVFNKRTNQTSVELPVESFSSEAVSDLLIKNDTQTSTIENIPALKTIKSIAAKNNEVKKVLSNLKKENISIEEKSWIDDYVLHNKKPSRKWKNKITYEVYMTPSIGYRTLNKNTNYSPPPISALISNPGVATPINYSLNHSSAVNLESGAIILMRFSKKLKFKTGIQFNYTNYNVNAYELNHPTFTTLLLNDVDNGYPMLTTRSTAIANTPGPASKKLNNNTYQISIPIGIDYNIAGNDKLKWYLGTSIQPTYVAGGHTFLVSSDLKNYVKTEDLMRKFNLNGSIETFLSYKTKSGVSLNAGPQFRYQFLSTHSSQYTYVEKLYNLGIKLGMSTNF